jgi:hypothetical protein
LDGSSLTTIQLLCILTFSYKYFSSKG